MVPLAHWLALAQAAATRAGPAPHANLLELSCPTLAAAQSAELAKLEARHAAERSSLTRKHHQQTAALAESRRLELDTLQTTRMAAQPAAPPAAHGANAASAGRHAPAGAPSNQWTVNLDGADLAQIFGSDLFTDDAAAASSSKHVLPDDVCSMGF
jgi:hypothetical protein